MLSRHRRIQALTLSAFHLSFVIGHWSFLLADDQEHERQQSVSQLATAKSRQIKMFVGGDDEGAALREKPLLRWSNPTAGSIYGEVFLWSHHDRPVAIASIYRRFHPDDDCTFEVVSTCSTSIVAREEEKLLWEAKEPAIEFRALDDKAGKTATARLKQMRSLAARFSAELIDRRTGEPVSRVLRLLSQPVHRYESAEYGVVDGGLFALVEVTDPEVWIVLEAIQRDDVVTWQYALARMNSDACQVKLDGREVHQWDKIEQPWRYRQAPYTLLGFTPAGE